MTEEHEPDIDPGVEPEPVPSWLPEALRMAERRLVFVIIVGGIGLLGALYALDVMSDLIEIVITALFFSFALEPAVSYLNTQRGWRRGVATGAVFVLMIGAGAFILALATPAIVSGFEELIDNAPRWVAKIAEWLSPFGVDVSQERLTEEIQKNAESVVTNAAGGVFAITSSILGGLFRWSAIGLFLFYIVAEGPTLRRVVCSMLPPERQRHVLFIWEQAIDQTGGYFYSRLFLAVINGTGMLIVLTIFGVPFSVPLSIFVGVVSAFVPIIGTYIGGAVPVLFAFLTSTGAGIAALVYVVVYQQLENFFLSPRLTAKTMSLHPAVAFAAALIGGALGGLLFAFLALPAAGVLQAALKARAPRYTVVEADLTNEPEAPPERPGLLGRARDAMQREGVDRNE